MILCDLLKVALSAFLSLIVIFLLTRIMGKRQLSQLSMFDYVIGITIGSIAAEMATELEIDILKPLVAMIVYAIFAVIISCLNDKSLKVRRFIAGKPILLFKNGKLYRENFKKARLDMNEFLTECRNNGYFDLSSVYMALLESNGRISFLPVTEKNPITPYDMKIKVTQEEPFANVILDGEIMYENLKNIGKDETWLKNELQKTANAKPKEVFLAACDISGTLHVYLKEEKAESKDIFT